MKTDSTTPGPWKAHLDVPLALVPGHIVKAEDVNCTPIALVPAGTGSSGPDKQRANALLIAAAPDLLEAAKEALSFLDPQSEVFGISRRVKAAIAKAEGRQS